MIVHRMLVRISFLISMCMLLCRKLDSYRVNPFATGSSNKRARRDPCEIIRQIICEFIQHIKQSLDTASCQVYNLLTSQLKLLDAANKPHIDIINLYEELEKGYDSPLTTWRCLNRLRTGYTCSKAQRKKWKFYTGDTTCACGKAEETTAHMLQCSQLAHPFSLDDIIMFNDVEKQCAELWKKMV